jgi:hypothetical protein
LVIFNRYTTAITEGLSKYLTGTPQWLVGWLFLTGTPQRVGRIRGADINADLIYLIVPQYTAGGQYPLSFAAALTGDCFE